MPRGDVRTGAHMVILAKKPSPDFFGGWLLLNLFQAGMTGLFDDEAYYWAYSNYPAWGYFDHPPIIALIIKAGYIIFRNELGVRLLVVLAATLALLIIEAILPKKDDPLFYAIACSMAVLQLGSFMALPDIPLMLFTAMFFLIYRRYLQRADAINIVLMGLVIALMMYSKYQSVLIIFFTLLSNPKLLLQKQTYWVALIVLACLLPHLNWQLQHGFISLQYQLERNSGNSYQLTYTLEYLLGQILFAGPFAGILLLWAAFVYRPADLFEKSLKYTLAGTYGFFLALTSQGRVEANWTLPAFIPLIILSYKYLQSRPVISKWLFRLAPVTLFCVLILRIYMTLNILPASWVKKDEVHGNHEWVKSIQEKAKDLPVVFLDSYQKASRYWFYTGRPSFSLNTPRYRRNNYNLWSVEDSLMNKPVYVVGGYDKVFFNDSIVTPKGLLGGMIIPHYLSFSKTNISPEKRLSVISGPEHTIRLIVVANQLPLKLSGLQFLHRSELQLWVNRNKQPSKIINTGIPLNQLFSGERHFSTSIPVDLPDGRYQARFAIPSTVPEMPTVNSAIIQLRLGKK